MEKRILKDIKRGEWFTLKPLEEPKETQVYIKGEFERSVKKYSCTKWADINAERMLKGSTVVYVGFTF